MWTLLRAAALATEPTAIIAHDGAVVGTATVSGTVDQVRSALADPAFVGRVHGGNTKVSVHPGGGDCQLVDYVSPNAIMTARYTVKRCPHKGGFAASLVESNTFKDYTTRWTLTQIGEQVEIRYRLFIVPKVLIPTTLVRNATRKSIDGLMHNLRDHFSPK